jgi:hypothetical protein
LPAYKWVLEHRLAKEVKVLRAYLPAKTLVLLDYETNGNVEDLSSPPSHASLVKYHLEDAWPAG